MKVIKVNNEVNSRRKILEGCYAFSDAFEGHLEDIFIKRKSDSGFYDILCLEHTVVEETVNS